MSERVLDWKGRHDPRSRRYGIADVVGGVTPMARMWRTGPTLDQGTEGACVGFAWQAELMAQPMPDLRANRVLAEMSAREIYRMAKRVDEWEGEAYNGTSVLAGAKVVQSMGHIGEYRWCFSVEEIIKAVVSEGPVVVGLPWLDSMFQPRNSGLLEVNGPVAGGHSLTIVGYHPNMRLYKEFWFKRFEVFKLRQSWGYQHGIGGDIFIKVEDMEKLLADQGEACVPMKRKPYRVEKR